MSNYKTVFFTLGILQIILGIFMIIPIIAQFFYKEVDSSFFGASIVTIIFGTLFFLSNLDHEKKLNLQQAFLLTALSWLSVAIFGSLPFFFSNLDFTFTNAFFESMSGITTTGSTIARSAFRRRTCATSRGRFVSGFPIATIARTACCASGFWRARRESTSCISGRSAFGDFDGF